MKCARCNGYAFTVYTHRDGRALALCVVHVPEHAEHLRRTEWTEGAA